MEYGGIYVLIVAGAYPATGVEFRAGGVGCVGEERSRGAAQPGEIRRRSSRLHVHGSRFLPLLFALFMFVAGVRVRAQFPR